jgi:hypothetical protein
MIGLRDESHNRRVIVESLSENKRTLRRDSTAEAQWPSYDLTARL